MAHAPSQTDLAGVDLQETEQKEEPLIERLFQGKKTAFNLDDLELKSVRIRQSFIFPPHPQFSFFA